jgi:hypothetical protein
MACLTKIYWLNILFHRQKRVLWVDLRKCLLELTDSMLQTLIIEHHFSYYSFEIWENFIEVLIRKVQIFDIGEVVLD